MINIKIENDIIIKAFKLATFEIEYNVPVKTPFKKKVVLEKQTKKYCLVFIPWKHMIKELKMISLNQIVDDNEFDDEVIKVDNFISNFDAEYPYHDEFIIRNFEGYKFIYGNNSFIEDVFESCFNEPLKILYKELPYLLNEEIAIKGM